MNSSSVSLTISTMKSQGTRGKGKEGVQREEGRRIERCDEESEERKAFALFVGDLGESESRLVWLEALKCRDEKRRAFSRPWMRESATLRFERQTRRPGVERAERDVRQRVRVVVGKGSGEDFPGM